MAVAGGSAFGGVVRFWLTEVALRASGSGPPWATMVVNVSGSALIGALAVLANGNAEANAWSPAVRHGWMAGLLGGFTTFSAFSLQTVTLWQQGHTAAAVVNVLGSVTLALVGCWAGASAVGSLGR